MSAIQEVAERSVTDNQKLLKSLYQEEHTSFSAVNTFLRCPRQYRYRYVQRETPEFTSDDLIFGSAFHRVVAGFYVTLKTTGERLPPSKLSEDWEIALERELSEAKAPVRFKRSKEDLLAQGKVMLEVYAESVNPRRIVAVEVPFCLPIDDPRTGEVLPVKLIGAVDLIEADDAGNLVVVELKTAAKKWSEGDVEMSLQGSLYSFVVSEMSEP